VLGTKVGRGHGGGQQCEHAPGMKRSVGHQLLIQEGVAGSERIRHCELPPGRPLLQPPCPPPYGQQGVVEKREEHLTRKRGGGAPNPVDSQLARELEERGDASGRLEEKVRRTSTACKQESHQPSAPVHRSPPTQQPNQPPPNKLGGSTCTAGAVSLLCQKSYPRGAPHALGPGLLGLRPGTQPPPCWPWTSGTLGGRPPAWRTGEPC